MTLTILKSVSLVFCATKVVSALRSLVDVSNIRLQPSEFVYCSGVCTLVAVLLQRCTYTENACVCKVRCTADRHPIVPHCLTQCALCYFFSALWDSSDLSEDFLRDGVKFTPCHFLHSIILSTSCNFHNVFFLKLPQLHAVLSHHFSDRNMSSAGYNTTLKC